MNIAAIKRECVSQRKAVIVNSTYGGQWVSDGVAAWPICGLKLTVKGLEELFNLSEKQLDKILIVESKSEDMRFERYQMAGEEQTDEAGALDYRGQLFLALPSERGNLFIPYNYVKHIRSDYRGYGIRWDCGRPLVAVYDGFEVGALVNPMSDGNAEILHEAAARLAAPRFVWPEEDAAEAERRAEQIAGQMAMTDPDGESEERG